MVKAIVFEDKNGNGLLDKGDGESGLTGIRLVLNGIKEVTGPDGVAIFRNLSAGTYSLSLDVSSIPVTMNHLFRSHKITLSGRDSKVSPELVPRGAEPEITLSSSQGLSEVKVILPTGEGFRLEGQGAKWHGRIPIPDNASSGALLLKVEALDIKGSIK